MSNTLTAWHYTIGARVNRIRAGGFICGATEGVPSWEKPVIWFSTRQDWEPTATKGYLKDDGTRRNATMEEMASEGGLWRFGMPTSDLLPWGALVSAARIRQKMLRGLLRAAEEVGADPYNWYGSIEPVPVERCIIQCRMAADDPWRTPMP